MRTLGLLKPIVLKNGDQTEEEEEEEEEKKKKSTTRKQKTASPGVEPDFCSKNLGYVIRFHNHIHNAASF